MPVLRVTLGCLALAAILGASAVAMVTGLGLLPDSERLGSIERALAVGAGFAAVCMSIVRSRERKHTGEPEPEPQPSIPGHEWHNGYFRRP